MSASIFPILIYPIFITSFYECKIKAILELNRTTYFLYIALAIVDLTLLNALIRSVTNIYYITHQRIFCSGCISVTPSIVIAYANHKTTKSTLIMYSQREFERRAAIMGGGNFVVPVQTVTDFLDNKLSGRIVMPFPMLFAV